MPNLNWYFPVVGQTEWSGGSYMDLSHRGRSHYAIDIYADAGSQIVAPVSGVVSRVRTSDIGGHTISIKGDDGIEYYFAHMAQPTPMAQGQRVNMGMMIGAVGRTGAAKTTSNHLHFSMKRNGKPINPKQYLDVGYTIPKLSAEAARNLPDNMTQYYAQVPELDYVSPFEVAENAIGESEPFEELQELTANDFLSAGMGSMADLVAGGQRQDYRQLGQQRVQRSQVMLNAATDEGQEPEKPRKKRIWRTDAEG